MRRRSFVSLLFLCATKVSAGGSLSAQTGADSATSQGQVLLEEIRSLISDMSTRASASEAAQQASVASCLNQVVLRLNGWEASGSVALNNLEAAASSGDSGSAAAQLELLKLTNREAKSAVAGASACDASTVVGGGVDADGDGIADGETSTGGISGLDDLQGDEETAEGFSTEEYLPSGDSVDDPATSDVVTSPAVTQ